MASKNARHSTFDGLACVPPPPPIPLHNSQLKVADGFFFLLFFCCSFFFLSINFAPPFGNGCVLDTAGVLAWNVNGGVGGEIHAALQCMGPMAFTFRIGRWFWFHISNNRETRPKSACVPCVVVEYLGIFIVLFCFLLSVFVLRISGYSSCLLSSQYQQYQMFFFHLTNT